MHQGRNFARSGKARFGLITSILLIFGIASTAKLSADDHAERSPVLDVASQELKRTMETLAAQDDPPYFLAYEINETQWANVSSGFGKLLSSTSSQLRQLDIDLRVGDYELDSSRQSRGGMWRGGTAQAFLPIEDDDNALRKAIWFHTDVAYKQALESLTRIRTNVNIEVEREDQSNDFSREERVRHTEPLATLNFDRAAWERKLSRYTEPFAQHDVIYQANANMTATAQNRWHVNSDGTEVQTTQTLYRLVINAGTRAEDGTQLPRYESFVAFSPQDLPGEAEVLAVVDNMIEDLLALREAPLVDPYVGPAILSGRAAGVFFHEVLGHRVEGHRVKLESDGQTFKKLVGETILPDFISVTSDPTAKQRDGFDLTGHYLFDNEGVPARPVTVVEDGALRNFLMSRTPIDGFPNSNGHGRRQPGFKAVSRQSNLMVETSAPVSSERLEAMLLERIRAEGKPFGLIFEDIQGGFTQTGRFMPNAFNVLPILVYRLLPDGSKELVRGVDLIGTPLTALTKIVAADDQVAVFNGVCGAESGGVPVSASSPALLIEQIEVQKKAKSQQILPILDSPTSETMTETQP